MRICSKCEESKDESAFYPSGRHSQCIACNREGASKWAKENRARINDRRRKPPRIFKTREQKLAIKRVQEKKRYSKIPDYIKQRVSAWKRANPHRVAATNALRKALVRRALPAWADLQKIQAVYSCASALFKATGIRHHVDHIVPIVHPLVCGLHTADNLQVLTESENCSKQNRWSPDDDAYYGRAKEAITEVA